MGWQEVADAVVNRRVELGMRHRRQLAEATGITVKTLGELERADRTTFDRATLATVEQALRWPAGTIANLAGKSTSTPGRTTTTVDLTPEQVAGLDPIRPGVEMPAALAELLHQLTSDYSRLTREERAQVESLLNEVVKTVALFLRDRPDPEVTPELQRSAPPRRP